MATDNSIVLSRVTGPLKPLVVSQYRELDTDVAPTTNNPFHFDTLIDEYDPNGDIAYNGTTHEWTLSVGRVYYLFCQFNVRFTASSGIAEYYWWNATASAAIGPQAYVPSVSASSEVGTQAWAASTLEVTGSAITVHVRPFTQTSVQDYPTARSAAIIIGYALDN